MDYNTEYCHPFDKKKNNIWMKLEHVGRYLFALEYFVKEKIDNVADIGSANGYGSYLLSQGISHITSYDRNKEYLSSSYYDNPKINKNCVDLDECHLGDNLYSAAVCFETLEHLKKPESLITKMHHCLKDKGILIVSFPNKKYEKFNEDGSNKDIYHLHVFDYEEMKKVFIESGFEVTDTFGQSICNKLCSMNESLVENGYYKQEEIDEAFNYDEKSIMTLAKTIAYPNKDEIDNSYSYIIVLRKK